MEGRDNTIQPKLEGRQAGGVGEGRYKSKSFHRTDTEC